MVLKTTKMMALSHWNSSRRLIPSVSFLAVLLLFVATCAYHYFIYLPEPNRPHRFTLLDDLFALGIVLLLGVVGLIVGKRVLATFGLRGFTRLEQGALAIGLGWGCLSLGVLLLGLLHVLFVWSLLAGLALIIVLCRRDFGQLLSTLSTVAWYRRMSIIRPRAPLEFLLALILAIQVLFVSIQALTLPIFPRGYDLYSYHWALPQLFLLHHAVYSVPGWANADFPINAEMLTTIALAFSSSVAATMIQMSFGLLGVMLISGFLYRHYGSLAAWLGALACMASPLFVGYLTSGYVEPATTFYGIATVVVILRWLHPQDGIKRAPDWKLPLLAGIFSGLGVGVKYQAGMVVVGVAVLMAVAATVQIAATRRRGSKLGVVLGRFALGTGIFFAGVLTPLLPWLLKDWFTLGNPIYPFIWGGPGWNEIRSVVGAEEVMHFGPQGSPAPRMIAAFFQLFANNGRADDPPFLPLNYLLLLAPLLVPVEVIRFWRRKSTREPGERIRMAQEFSLVLVIAGAYGIWVAAHTTEDRYAMSWLMLLAIPAVILLLHIFSATANLPAFRRALQLVVIFLLLLGPLYSLSFSQVSQPFPLLFGQMSLKQWEEQHLLARPGYWDMVGYIEHHIPPQTKLLLVGTASWGYFLPGYDYVGDTDGDWVPYLMTAGRTPSGVLQLLRRQGFSYITFEEKSLEFNAEVYQGYAIATYLPAFRHFLARSLVLVQVYGNYSLYRIPGG